MPGFLLINLGGWIEEERETIQTMSFCTPLKGLPVGNPSDQGYISSLQKCRGVALGL